MNKHFTRTFVLAVAVAAAGAALGSGAASADGTGTARSVPAGHTVCIDLATSGTEGDAYGVSDLPLRYSLEVRDDAAADFAVVAQSDGATTHWRADVPAASGYVVRTVRACAFNDGAEASDVFLTIETDEDDQVGPGVGPVAETPPVPDSSVGDGGVTAVEDALAAVQALVESIESLLAELSAAAG